MAAEPTDSAWPTRGSSAHFCSNSRCIFHVRVGDPGVNGVGDWCTTADGITTSHCWVDGELLCDLCARRRSKEHDTG